MSTYIPVMWSFVGVIILFVGLRLYTRVHIKDQLGWDDHIYTASSVSTVPRPWKGNPFLTFFFAFFFYELMSGFPGISVALYGLHTKICLGAPTTKFRE